MNKLNYTFSLKEKIIILILVLILMGLGYYYFIDRPIRADMKAAEYAKEDLMVELDIMNVKVAQLRQMRSELENMSAENTSYMESYNASKQEISFLNDILRGTERYNIDFSDVSMDGDLIRRPFSLQFSTSDYEGAKNIINQLYNSKLRCLIADININSDKNSFDEGVIHVVLNAYFYETMNGGVYDSGLPANATN